MDPIEITYYTDPLCCWSWGMEPAILQLRQEYGEKISWRFCMGGLIPNWNRFIDPLNNVNRPIQMGPVWMHAASITGMKIKHTIWFSDPPSSSYPSCIAFKSVQLQSPDLAIRYLQLLRSACMLDGINISKSNELFRLAKMLKQKNPAFDLALFKKQFKDGSGTSAFRADLDEIRLKNISRFPTLLFRKKNSHSLIATGYRPYEALLEIVNELLPENSKILKPENQTPVT